MSNLFWLTETQMARLEPFIGQGARMVNAEQPITFEAYELPLTD